MQTLDSSEMQMFEIPKINFAFFLLAISETLGKPKRLAASLSGSADEINRGGAFFLVCCSLYVLSIFGGLKLDSTGGRLVASIFAVSILQAAISAVVYAAVFLLTGTAITLRRVFAYFLFYYGTFMVVFGLMQLALIGYASFVDPDSIGVVKGLMANCFVDEAISGELIFMEWISGELIFMEWGVLYFSYAVLLLSFLLGLYLEVAMLAGFYVGSKVGLKRYLFACIAGYLAVAVVSLVLVAPVLYAAVDFDSACASIAGIPTPG